MKKTIVALSQMLLFLILFEGTAHAQIAKFQSAYIFNFSRYIEWPKEFQTGNFVIGVLGINEGVTTELKKIESSQKVFGRTVEIKVFASVEAITLCPILFIPESQSDKIEAVSAKAAKGVLIISNKSGGIKKGSAINFVLVDNKLKFELKKATALAKGLKVSPDLEKLAYKTY